VSDAPAAGLSELQKRVLSGIVMALVAIGVTVWGGLPFALVWTAAALCVAYEWQRIVHGEGALPIAAQAVVAAGLAAFGAFWGAPMLLAAAIVPILSVLTLAPAQSRGISATGALYASALGASAIFCRSVGYDGALVIFWLFAVVWGTDTLAYFTGRALGGPKLWPSVSPKKTWSDATGGLLGGVLLGCLLIAALGVVLKWQHVALSCAFSVLTQAGDLYESALKRRFGVKDAGNLIPGHGGFMDRLDGFIFAVAFAALFGVWRAGVANVPAGLITW
jgi:phosphatidate cytidylyltransferase